MKYLVIDSSFGTLVALVESLEEKVSVLARATNSSARGHAENLVPIMSEVTDGGNISVDAVIVSSGPAPFTGIRAGLVAGRVFGFVNKIPVYGLCSLDAFAAKIFQEHESSDENQINSAITNKFVAVATDARRKEIYGALYRRQESGILKSVLEPNVFTPSQFISAIKTASKGEPMHITGNVPELVISQIEDEQAETIGSQVTFTSSSTQEFPDPAQMVSLVEERLRLQGEGQEVDLSLEPKYLRRPDVFAGVR